MATVRVPGPTAVGDTAGEVVVEVQLGGGLAGGVGEAEGSLWVFKEDVRVGSGGIEVEEADRGVEAEVGEIGGLESW